jgi:hypothetical protein
MLIVEPTLHTQRTYSPLFHADAFRRTDAAGRNVVRRGGRAREDAKVVSHHLDARNLCGLRLHGVMRVPQYLQSINEGSLRPCCRHLERNARRHRRRRELGSVREINLTGCWRGDRQIANARRRIRQY